MEQRILGRTGLKVSALGFGAAEIGFEGIGAAAAEQLLNSALDAGLNVIDTAECYSNSEELIGGAIGHRRSEFYLFTKCGHQDETFADAWRPSDIERSIERSLKRLKTDYVDLVQLHSCDQDVLARGDAIEALLKAKAAGKTRFIGYSGDSTSALYAINTEAFDTLQTSVSIADQECIDLTLPRARTHNMGVIAKRPLANIAWRYDSMPDNDYHRPYWERLTKISYDFLNGDPKKSLETALRFTLSVPGVHTIIAGTSKGGRWQENAEVASRGALSESEYTSIRKAWKRAAAPDWVGLI